MIEFVLRRLLFMIPTFFGVTLLCFLLMRAANSDPVVADVEAGLKGQQISQELLEHLRATYDLDKPWYVQYGKLVGRLVTLDLGNRWQDGRPIAEVVGEALPITLLLSFSALLIAYLIAIPVGIYSAVRQYSLTDQIITIKLFVLYSLPAFWIGIVLLMLLASGKYVDCPWTDAPGCFPLQGWRTFEGFAEMSWWERVKDVAFHLVLPLVTLTYGSFAGLSRYMRSGMLETIRQDYIRTARAKGLDERAVIIGHALKNSVLSIITLLGLELPSLIGGAVVVESIFGIRGMGLVALEALRMPDYPVVLTLVAFTAILTMLGILLSDVLYALVDPRVRLGGGSR
jgi:peptide/nickel transport system permease protein